MGFLKFKKTNSIIAIVVGALFIWSCSSNKLDRPETLTYTGPGSYYSMVMNNDGTFEVEVRESFDDASADLTVNGTYEVLENGIIEYTVESSTGTGGPSAGEKAYGLEAVGYGLFLLPLGGSEVIPMMVKGTCPDSNFKANWVMTQNTSGSDSSSTDSDFFGVFDYNSTTGEGEVTKKRNLVDFEETVGGGGGAFSTDSCDDGFLQISAGGGESANMWLTSIGGAMVETQTSGERNSTIFALPRDTNVLADIEGTFRGIVVDNETGVGEGDDNESFFVQLTFDNSGNGTGNQVTSINPWETGSEGAVVTLAKNNDVGEGWYTGTLETQEDGGPQTANLACAFTQNVNDTNKDILLCVAQSPGGLSDGGTASTFNMILVKDSN